MRTMRKSKRSCHPKNPAANNLDFQQNFRCETKLQVPKDTTAIHNNNIHINNNPQLSLAKTNDSHSRIGNSTCESTNTSASVLLPHQIINNCKLVQIDVESTGFHAAPTHGSRDASGDYLQIENIASCTNICSSENKAGETSRNVEDWNIDHYGLTDSLQQQACTGINFKKTSQKANSHVEKVTHDICGLKITEDRLFDKTIKHVLNNNKASVLDSITFEDSDNDSIYSSASIECGRGRGILKLIDSQRNGSGSNPSSLNVSPLKGLSQESTASSTINVDRLISVKNLSQEDNIIDDDDENFVEDPLCKSYSTYATDMPRPRNCTPPVRQWHCYENSRGGFSYGSRRGVGPGRYGGYLFGHQAFRPPPPRISQTQISPRSIHRNQCPPRYEVRQRGTLPRHGSPCDQPKISVQENVCVSAREKVKNNFDNNRDNICSNYEEICSSGESQEQKKRGVKRLLSPKEMQEQCLAGRNPYIPTTPGVKSPEQIEELGDIQGTNSAPNTDNYNFRASSISPGWNTPCSSRQTTPEESIPPGFVDARKNLNNKLQEADKSLDKNENIIQNGSKQSTSNSVSPQSFEEYEAMKVAEFEMWKFMHYNNFSPYDFYYRNYANMYGYMYNPHTGAAYGDHNENEGVYGNNTEDRNPHGYTNRGDYTEDRNPHGYTKRADYTEDRNPHGYTNRADYTEDRNPHGYTNRADYTEDRNPHGYTNRGEEYIFNNHVYNDGSQHNHRNPKLPVLKDYTKGNANTSEINSRKNQIDRAQFLLDDEERLKNNACAKANVCNDRVSGLHTSPPVNDVDVKNVRRNSVGLSCIAASYCEGDEVDQEDENSNQPASDTSSFVEDVEAIDGGDTLCNLVERQRAKRNQMLAYGGKAHSVSNTSNANKSSDNINRNLFEKTKMQSVVNIDHKMSELQKKLSDKKIQLSSTQMSYAEAAFKGTEYDRSVPLYSKAWSNQKEAPVNLDGLDSSSSENEQNPGQTNTKYVIPFHRNITWNAKSKPKQRVNVHKSFTEEDEADSENSDSGPSFEKASKLFRAKAATSEENSKNSKMDETKRRNSLCEKRSAFWLCTPNERNRSVKGGTVTPPPPPGFSMMKQGYGGCYDDSAETDAVTQSATFTPEFSAGNTAMMRRIQKMQSQSGPANLGMNRKPDDPLGMVQWRNWKEKFRESYRNVHVPFIDTHCHIDFLFDRSNFAGTFSEYIEKNADTFLPNFDGCVAVFCNPRNFTPENALWKSVLKENDVYVCVGCHPKSATDFTAKNEYGMRQMLKHEKVVAVGEIGLDYSGTFSQHAEIQKLVLVKQCKIALELKKPIVIHSRDSEEDIITVLSEHVPRNYKIHRHCFTGNWEDAENWLKKFPNSFIGLTPIITWYTDRAQAPREVARRVPLDRLLLETDSPYFVPKGIPRDEVEFSHPGYAITVASEVAKMRGIPVDRVLTACRQNSLEMYGF